MEGKNQQTRYDTRSLRKLVEIVESQREELHCARPEEVQRRDQQLLQGQLLQQNLELREAHQKSLSEMEEVKKFQSSTFDTIARRRLVEDQDTILELTGKIQELQYEINCMSDSKRGFRMLNQLAVEIPTLPVDQCHSHSSNSWSAEPQRRAAKHLGHAWYIGKRFCRSSCVLYSTISAGIETMEFIDRGAAANIHSGKE